MTPSKRELEQRIEELRHDADSDTVWFAGTDGSIGRLTPDGIDKDVTADDLPDDVDPDDLGPLADFTEVDA